MATSNNKCTDELIEDLDKILNQLTNIRHQETDSKIIKKIDRAIDSGDEFKAMMELITKFNK